MYASIGYVYVAADKNVIQKPFQHGTGFWKIRFPKMWRRK